jgi:hypothetical protein
MRNPSRCCEQAVGSSKVSCHENSFEPSKGPENIELVVLSIGLWSIDLNAAKNVLYRQQAKDWFSWTVISYCPVVMRKFACFIMPTFPENSSGYESLRNPPVPYPSNMTKPGTHGCKKIIYLVSLVDERILTEFKDW